MKWEGGQRGPEARGPVGWAGGRRKPQKCLSRVVIWSDSCPTKPSGCCMERGSRLQVALGDEFAAMVVFQERGEW